MSRRDYSWTTGRIAAGVLIVVAGIGVVTVLAIREFSKLPPSNDEWIKALAAFEAQVRQQQGGRFDGFNIEDLRVPREMILAGGPRKDGIPALTEPAAVPVSAAGFLADSARVVGVTIGGVSRAYPISVLIQHEAVNDVLGDVPIAVVYCPLCDSASVVDRRLDGRTYEFGVSGRLVNSNVLLYDRTDDALWSQIGFTAISGPNAGRSLRHLPWTMTRFDGWRTTHPGSSVMSYETGHGRNYDRRPYGDYFETDRLYFPVAVDPRLSVKTKVVGVLVGTETRAYPLSEIARAPGAVVHDRLGDAEITLEGAAGTDSVRVLEASPEMRIVHTYWFAWAAFHPGTDIYRSKP